MINIVQSENQVPVNISRGTSKLHLRIKKIVQSGPLCLWVSVRGWMQKFLIWAGHEHKLFPTHKAENATVIQCAKICSLFLAAQESRS